MLTYFNYALTIRFFKKYQKLHVAAVIAGTK